MKSLFNRNPLLASVLVTALLAMSAAGYVLAVDHGSQTVVPQAPTTMLLPF